MLMTTCMRCPKGDRESRDIVLSTVEEADSDVVAMVLW
jgi:hypothetical protein